MKHAYETHYLRVLGGLLLSGTLVVAANGCSSSSSSDDDDVEEMSVSLGNQLENIPLVAGQRNEVKFTYNIPGDITTTGDFSINVARTLQNVSLSANPAPRGASIGETLTMLARLVIKQALAAETAQVTAHISFADDPDVCTSPIQFGPYTVTGMIGEAVTSPTTSVSPTQKAVNLSNTGSIEVCFVSTPPISAYVNVSAVEVDVEPCAEPTVSIDGSSWSGTYECDNFGIPSEGPANIMLTISENPDGSYTYTDDGGATYDGHLCGNKLKYNGGVPMDYSESGTLVFSGDTQASKTSSWNSEPPGSSGGDCTDTLSRM